MDDRSSRADLIRRVVQLERELATRPTQQQVEFVQEYAARREQLYQAVLRRNEILARRLKETG